MYGGLVDEAEAALREWLRTFVPPKDRRLPSERALATELKLQHYAVNRAMARLVAEGLLHREGYRLYLRDNAAQTAPVQKEVCELVIAQRSVQLRSFQKVARELGIELNVHPWQSSEEMVSILQGLKPKDIQCIVMDPPFGYTSALWEAPVQHLLKQGIPVVSISQQAPGVPCVMADNCRALIDLLNYMLELGHREFMFLSVSPWNQSSVDVIEQWKSHCRTLGLEKSVDRIWLQNESRLMAEDARAVANALQSDWPEVTALIAYLNSDTPVQRIVSDFKAKGIRVPAQLSVAFVGDSEGLKFCDPPVTATVADMALLHETAYRLAFRYVRKRKERGALFDGAMLRVQEQLVIRSSTAPGPFYQSPSTRPIAKVETTLPAALPIVETEKVLDVDAAWRHPYQLTAQAPEARFTTVDLANYVNRPLIFRRGWLGDLPLRHLPPGRQVVHGIPFQVLGGKTRADCGAIVFRSLINTTGSEKKLPISMDIPIDLKATAIYVLHGCGYCKFFYRFATYTFFSGKEEVGMIPIISLGRPMPDTNQEKLDEALKKSNIQDWWPDFPHYNFEHARMAPLLENALPDSAHRHLFLYTLEWINPQPKRVISHLRIEVNPEQSTSLGVLGISALSVK